MSLLQQAEYCASTRTHARTQPISADSSTRRDVRYENAQQSTRPPTERSFTPQKPKKKQQQKKNSSASSDTLHFLWWGSGLVGVAKQLALFGYFQKCCSSKWFWRRHNTSSKAAPAASLRRSIVPGRAAVHQCISQTHTRTHARTEEQRVLLQNADNHIQLTPRLFPCY